MLNHKINHTWNYRFYTDEKTTSLWNVMKFIHIGFNFISIFFNVRLELSSKASHPVENDPPLLSITEAFRWFHYEETVAARCQANWMIWKCPSTTLISCTVHFTYDLSEQSMKPNEGLVMCSFSFVTTRGFPVMHIHPQCFIVGIKCVWLQQNAIRAFPLSPRLSSSIKISNVGLIVLIVLPTVGWNNTESLTLGEIILTLWGILLNSCGTANDCKRMHR